MAVKTFQARRGLVAAVMLALAAGAHAQAPAAGDAVRGKELYQSRCGGCHSVDSNRIGPMHAGVFGRRAGSVAGYNYSEALKASKVVWNAKTLDQWLAGPEAFIPGQRMYLNVPEAVDRADVIAYLATLKAPESSASAATEQPKTDKK